METVYARHAEAWHIARLRVEADGAATLHTLCGRYGFNHSMPRSTEIRKEHDPPLGRLCIACQRAALHTANVGGQHADRPVSSAAIGTGRRWY